MIVCVCVFCIYHIYHSLKINAYLNHDHFSEWKRIYHSLTVFCYDVMSCSVCVYWFVLLLVAICPTDQPAVRGSDSPLWPCNPCLNTHTDRIIPACVCVQKDIHPAHINRNTHTLAYISSPSLLAHMSVCVCVSVGDPWTLRLQGRENMDMIYEFDFSRPYATHTHTTQKEPCIVALKE